MLPINELLQEGRYLITRQIGQNDIGAIYEGVDNIFEKKIIINQCAYSGRKNLSDEEKILKGIKHEAFLHVTDYFAELNSWFVIMEAEDGEFLSEVLKNEKSGFQFLDVINWTEQLLDGFRYIHLNLPPVIYGDLRAQNIFLTSGGKIKLLASAILKNRISIPNFGKSSSAALNHAPLEQIWNSFDSASQKVIADSYDETAGKILREPADARSDIFSLGVLIYRLLSGEFPKNALERSIEILEGNPDPLVSPSEINAEIPPEISEIIMKTLEIRREDRLDSAVIMRQILRTAFVRIKEREAASAEQQEPTETLVLEESFALSDIASPEEIKTAEPIQISEGGEMPEEPILEIEAGNKIKTVSAEFFNFDEDDEKLLSIENSAELIKETKPSPEIIEEKAEILDVQTSEKIVPEVVKTDFAKDYTPDEFSILFDNTEEKNRSKWTIPVVVIILVLAGSGVLGAWMFISKSDSNAATQTVQTVSSQPEIKPPVNAASEPPAENLTLSNSEPQTSSNTEGTTPTPQTDIEANPVLTQETAPPAKKQTMVKTKPDVSKPQTASAKTPAKEKKKVTADDLISDY
ncbi:MAG: protein kinase domain-containing protein [Pyrinomonadaceae bacterium]